MNETIAAIATGQGRSAIGVIRLSGPQAITVASTVFRPVGNRSLGESEDRRMVFGSIQDRDGVVIDQGLAVVFHGPATETGEDSAELHCHGSPMVLAMALEALYAAGARPAGPGEFTKRAFLSGKLDLTQAEALIDLIDAETPNAAKCAARQLSGALGRHIQTIYDSLVNLMAHFHAVLDYPDEDIDPFSAQELGAQLHTSEQALGALLATYERGRHLAGGVPCAIVGRPNAGKSSLLNALLGYDRAIVTAVPGTTRDTIEERCILGGVLLRLIDTAGLRESGDAVEQLGVARSRTALNEAALVLLVVDGSAPLTEEDTPILAAAQTAERAICLINKSDLSIDPSMASLGQQFPHLCMVSAATGAGLSELEIAVSALFPQGETAVQGELLTNARQAEATQRAQEAVCRAREGLAIGMTPDAVLMDVEVALAALGELSGRTVREDVTSRIFSRFCVGK